MGNPLYYILFSLIFGFFQKQSLLLLIFPASFIVLFIFKKRLLISLSITLALLTGVMLSLSKEESILGDGEYVMVQDIKRSLRYDYIATSGKRNFLLKTNFSLFEGDRVFGSFKVKKLSLKNDYEKYLVENKIFCSASPIEIDSVKSVRGVERIRTILINRIKDLYPDDDLNGFLNSLLWGYRKDLNASLKKGFLHSGVIHLIAISGQHTTIVFALLMALLFPLPIPKKVKIILSLLIVLFYGFLTYLNPPVMRAVLFIFIMTVGSLFSRETDSENMLMIAMMLMLVFNRNNFYDEGFMLSFIAVYGLIITPRLCIPKKKILQLLLSSVVILLLTMPFMMYRFKYISVGSPLFTIILLPLFNIVLPAALISLFIPAAPLKFLVEVVFCLMEKIVYFSEKLPLFFNFTVDTAEFILMFSIVFTAINKKFRMSALFSLSLFLYALFRFSCS